MAAKQPFWEVKNNPSNSQPWWAHLKGKNGRVVVTTETYAVKGSVLKAIKVADPEGKFEIRGAK